jgi:flagellar hook-length control protein FliK
MSDILSMLPLGPQTSSQGETPSVFEGLATGESLFENLILTFLGLGTELLSEESGSEADLLQLQKIQGLSEIDFSKMIGELLLSPGMISTTIAEQGDTGETSLLEIEAQNIEMEDNTDPNDTKPILDLSNLSDNLTSQTAEKSIQISPIELEEPSAEIMQYELALVQAEPETAQQPTAENNNVAEKAIPVTQIQEKPKQDLQAALAADADEDLLQTQKPLSLSTEEQTSKSDNTAQQQFRISSQNFGEITEADSEEISNGILQEVSKEAGKILNDEMLKSESKINTAQSQFMNAALSETDEQILLQQNLTTQSQVQNAQTASAVDAPQQTAKIPEVHEQVAIKFIKAVDNKSNEIQIKLVPENLGKINIRLEISDQRINATFQADNADTLKLLQADSKALENALRNAGFDLDKNDLEFSFTDREETSPHDQSNKHDQKNAALFDEESLEDEDLAIDLPLTEELISLIPREHTLLSNQQISITV